VALERKNNILMKTLVIFLASIFRYFMPQRDDELKTWNNNFKQKLSGHAATVGVTPAEVTAANGQCDAINNAVDDVAQKKAAFESSVQAKENIKKQNIPLLLALINRIKAHFSYTTTIGEDLDIVSEKVAVDPNAKATLKGQAFKGYNRLTFKKAHLDGENIYVREKGTTDWGKKLTYDTNSPYDHHETIVQGKTYEYMAIGVIDDFEVGLPSDIVEITAI